MNVLQDNNLKLIIAVLILGVIGGSLVGPILPAMISPLETSEEKVGLVLSVYTFLALVSTPLLGPLADRFGRKTILVPCTVLFGVSGLAIAFSEAFWLVLLLRALQGIGVGGMMNTGVTLIGDLYTGERRAQAMGYRISFQTITNAILPFVSGGLATLAWFYPFYIYSLAIPLGLLVGFKLSLNPVSPDEEKLPRRAYIKQLWRVVLHHKSIWVFFFPFHVFFPALFPGSVSAYNDSQAIGIYHFARRLGHFLRGGNRGDCFFPVRTYNAKSFRILDYYHRICVLFPGAVPDSFCTGLLHLVVHYACLGKRFRYADAHAEHLCNRAGLVAFKGGGGLDFHYHALPGSDCGPAAVRIYTFQVRFGDGFSYIRADCPLASLFRLDGVLVVEIRHYKRRFLDQG